MQYEHLRNVDLNLLIALHALMEERSVTGAARRMFVSQPAMSRMFDRLQTMFKDELLIRTPKGYEPTYRASVIYAELQQTLPKLQAVLGRSEFDPARATGLFRIEASDWGATVLVPGLVRIIADRAPGIQVDVVPRQSSYEALEANEVDLVLGGPLLRSGNDEEFLRSECLLRDKLVCLMRKGHPLCRRRLTFREYVKARHISLSSTPSPRRAPLSFSVERQPSLAQAIERLGEKPNVLVRVPYFTPLGIIVGSTDLIATLPLHIARRVKTTKTRIVSAPSEFLGVSFHQIWHSRNDSSPIHEWVRGVIRDLAAEVTRERTAKD
jgi:DNA-binding transcriptional LysR family regulator